MIKDRLNYLNKDVCFYVGKIYEYDIKHAYPSILKSTSFNFEDRELRNDIERLDEYNDKKSLLIRIGKEIRKNKKIIEYINTRLIQLIETFQYSNNLNEDTIISIKKDALFVTKECKSLIYDDIVFIEKHNFDLYFYDYIKKYEYYIKRKYGILEYNIKGLGSDFDEHLYGCISKLIYKTLINNDLSYIKELQELFMNEKIKAIDYCPSLIPYKEKIYIHKDKLLKDNKMSEVNLRAIYFDFYSSVCKSLISYLL